MIRQTIPFICIILLLLSTCELVQNQAPADTNSTITIETDMVELDNVYFEITAFGSDMDTIGPRRFTDSENIILEVREGTSRTIICQCYHDNGTLLATGTLSADINNERTIFIPLSIVYKKPAITHQPENIQVATGDWALFTVTAEGDSLSFQWQKNNENISGADSSHYIINAANTADDGDSFRCIVSNLLGSDTSNGVILRVFPPPNPDTTHPQITILGGDTVYIPINDPDNMLASFYDSIEVTDAGGGPIMISSPVLKVDIFTARSTPYTMTYTAQDITGNTSTAIRYIFIFIPQITDTVPPILRLSIDTIYMMKGGEFVIPVCTAFDLVDGDLNDNIVVTGTVDTETPGTYTLTYTVADSAGNQTVATQYIIVQEIRNDQPPVITLLGLDTITIPEGISIDEFMDMFIEPGYTAYDYYGNDITSDVSVSEIHEITTDIWSITYSVTDEWGKVASPKRRLFFSTPNDPEVLQR